MSWKLTNAWPALIVLLVVYTSGYFKLSEFHPRDPKQQRTLFSPIDFVPAHHRYFKYDWAEDIYRPAACIESWLRMAPIDTGSPGDWVDFHCLPHR